MSGSPENFADLWASDRPRQNAAYTSVMAATSVPVPWAGDVWDDVVANLAHRDNHNRAIAAQVLCNLAAHDSSGRIIEDLEALMTVSRDDRFVTARHCLRSLWRIGLGGSIQRRAVLAALDQRYRQAAAEKNGTLIRSDIIESLRRLHDAVSDPAIEATARALIEIEPDLKYRRKYSQHWK